MNSLRLFASQCVFVALCVATSVVGAELLSYQNVATWQTAQIQDFFVEGRRAYVTLLLHDGSLIKARHQQRWGPLKARGSIVRVLAPSGHTVSLFGVVADEALIRKVQLQ